MVLENGLNPASLSMDKNTSLNFSHGNWLADSKVSSLKWTFPNKKSSFGVDLKYASLGDLELRTERPTDDHLAYYNASGFSLGGLYSKEFDRFNAGAAIRFVRIDLYTENSTGIAIDLGTKYHLSRSTVLGAAIMNIGKMSELKNETREKLLVKKEEPGNYIDILSIIEQPNFIEFYKKELEDLNKK